MVSADKLIKVGVKYSDQYFEQLKALYIRAYANSMSFEEFLDETSDYSIGNPLEAGGFKDTLSDLIVSSTNDIRFSRPAQKALMQTIIRNTTGELIVNVGDDIKHGVRNIVGRGYRNGKLNHKRVADEITHELDGINHKRARTIARTEIKRAQTTSNYVVALERGANAYKYKCGAKPCDICKKDCGKTYPITDLEHLPPRHPSCMCGVTFFKDPNLPEVEKPTTATSTEPTTTQLKKNLTKDELEQYNWAKSVLSKDFHTDKMKAKAKATIDKLNEKAIGTSEITVEPTSTTTSKPKTTTSQLQEPTTKQLQDNLSKSELKQYREHKEMVDWANGVMNNPNLGKKQKDYAKSRLAEIEPQLNQLKQKALGQSVEVTPKTETKPKTSSKPQTKKNEPNNMSSEELYNSMTASDKKKYDKVKKQLETTNKNLDELGENPLLLDMKKKQLLELRKLEEKQIAKLSKKSSPKKKTSQKIFERTLDNIHNEVDIPTKKLIPELEAFAKKRYKNTIEYGYHFDVKKGKLVGDELRGKKGGVAIQDKGAEYGSIHSHPTNGMSPPSADDLVTFRCKQENHHFMVSEHEIWYVKATDNFGIMGKMAQIDLVEAHTECVARGKAKVADDIKKGVLSADEDELRIALDKAVGDEVLKTFNSPPWNKTITVKRYYR